MSLQCRVAPGSGIRHPPFPYPQGGRTMTDANSSFGHGRAGLFWPVIGIAICAAVLANTYAYVMATTIPLPQADAWRFMSGFLRKYIEGNLSFLDFFAQGKAGDTNQPLQKLILIFHTRFFDMDFSVEGVIGLLVAVMLFASVLLLGIRDSARGFGRAEAGLAAGLALVLFSLNSTNVYTWGLVTLWFLPVLLIVWFIGYAVTPGAKRSALLATGVLLGVLLDEVAFLGFFATLGAVVVVGRS